MIILFMILCLVFFSRKKRRWVIFKRMEIAELIFHFMEYLWGWRHHYTTNVKDVSCRKLYRYYIMYIYRYVCSTMSSKRVLEEFLSSHFLLFYHFFQWINQKRRMLAHKDRWEFSCLNEKIYLYSGWYWVSSLIMKILW